MHSPLVFPYKLDNRPWSNAVDNIVTTIWPIHTFLASNKLKSERDRERLCRPINKCQVVLTFRVSLFEWRFVFACRWNKTRHRDMGSISFHYIWSLPSISTHTKNVKSVQWHFSLPLRINTTNTLNAFELNGIEGMGADAHTYRTHGIISV